MVGMRLKLKTNSQFARLMKFNARCCQDFVP
jgi:hypothetical protein